MGAREGGGARMRAGSVKQRKKMWWAPTRFFWPQLDTRRALAGGGCQSSQPPGGSYRFPKNTGSFLSERRLVVHVELLVGRVER